MLVCTVIVALLTILLKALFKLIKNHGIENKISPVAMESLMLPAIIYGLAEIALPYMVLVTALVYFVQKV